MARVRKDCLYVAFIDMEKDYDRVNRKKLFEVIRGYGVQEILVDVIERIYNGSMVKFEEYGGQNGICKRSTWHGKVCSCKVWQ